MQKRKLYYLVKPLIPRRLQIYLRRKMVMRKRILCRATWPIDEKARRRPEGWPGWPEGKRFALVLTHDVETMEGQTKCWQLMDLEKRMGFRSSFNFVPKQYEVSQDLRSSLFNRGFEVGVHGLYHDGKLYDSKQVFNQQAMGIKFYLKEWGAVGFRSPSMYHNLDWIQDLNIEYDSSTFDTDPFEPQPDGVETIYPFFVGNPSHREGYVELPYTLPQDFTLFVLLQEKNIDIWKKKLDWIAENGGMALLISHPDYMSFERKRPKRDDYPIEFYEEFLDYVKKQYSGEYWHVLPKDMARFAIAAGIPGCARFSKR
jgi:hypothetical protein